MVVTVLFYLSMMVSYLVQSRERDTALLRSRGVGTLQLLRVYALEGLVMTVVAVALAPFLALGGVALAGKLPYFSGTTGGGLLPVNLSATPFLGALGVGLLCLAIFVIPGALGARGGLLLYKLRSSRPPTVPFFHRYYLDVALISIGGLVFWELRSRGHIISGGLFKDLQVNETLLLAPVLFLIVVALVFLRFFPLVVRFISGESPALLHLVAATTVVVLGPGIAIRDMQEGSGLAWLGPVALVLAAGGAYWATGRARRPGPRLAGLIIQAGLVAGFVALEPPGPGELLFAPAVGLISIVPAQVAFLLLRASIRVTPVWVSMGLWRMARNPLQYTWLILLLVLVTGAGLLSTTVGGTLERSVEERILYDVAADIRLAEIPKHLAMDSRSLKDSYLNIPGVMSASLALRASGSAGPARAELLALESREFEYLSWYRDDFSALPLSGVMQALQLHPVVDRLTIPDGATAIGAWVRPEKTYPNVSVWMVLEDSTGIKTTVSLSEVGPPEWHLLRTSIPSWMRSPVHLVSVQIFEPGFGAVATPGTMLIDDIHITAGVDGEEQIIDDFEGEMRWTPILTAGITSDRVQATSRDAYRGRRAAVFSFGKDTVDGVRGFYQSPTGGPLPIVLSSPLADALGLTVGNSLNAKLVGRILPVVIRGTVEYFPTMSPDDRMFMVVDLDDLLGHLNVMTQRAPTSPNELFLKEEPGSHREVREAIDISRRFAGQLFDRAAKLESVRSDPLTVAGWRSVVVVSLAIVVLTAGLGYITYLLSFASRSEGEIGFLRSMGLSRRQLMGLLTFEHLAVVAIGLGLGSWAGHQMSRTMVSSVAVTETGDQVAPPFILMTDWGLMLPTYAALAGVFLVSLLILTRKVLGQELNAISRVEGI
jgi:ABC-type lipoprotein release transport system permease subunit